MLDTFPAPDLHELAIQDQRARWDQESRDFIARTPVYTEEPLPSRYYQEHDAS